MLSKYMKPRARRIENRTLAGRFRGGVLAPVMATPFRESESGLLKQSVTFELDQIPGRLITEITAEVVAVYVPVQAMDALKDPASAYAGSADALREKLLAGTPLFDLVAESEVSKRCGVVPRSVSGVKYVSEAVQLAHNAAVNFLRTRKYVKAAKLLATDTGITPAIIGQTVLDRLNGVLDPEDRVNGAVALDQAITLDMNYVVSETATGTNGSGWSYKDWTGTTYVGTGHEVAAKPGFEPIVKILGGGQSQLVLTDFYNAERMDALVREMRKLVDENPEYGEEIVARFAHGLGVDVGKQPFVVYEKEQVLGMGIARAMDGANLDVVQTDVEGVISFTAPIPPTEFGGIVITFAAIKPDETLASQPHPILSDTWSARNYVADEMAVDPVPVYVRDLDGDCAQADEETLALYTGNNELLRNYVNYGFNRFVDPLTVDSKTAIWQLQVPMSVTPESVLYPVDIPQTPFADTLAEVCTYTVSSLADVNTPVIFGPTPVEELAAIETSDVFADAPAV